MILTGGPGTGKTTVVRGVVEVYAKLHGLSLNPKEYAQRLLVTPGITGLAQVSGRGEIELSKTVYYDLTYIKNFSVWYDIKILFQTVFKVFKNEGAF